AFLRDQRLDPLLDAVVAQAGRALFEVVLELVPGFGGAFAVEQRPYLRDHRRTFRVLGIDGPDRWGPVLVLAHEDTSSGASSRCPPRLKPRSLATSANRVRSWRLPRCNRDITVPIGVSIISAISLYGKPSTSA